MNFELLKMYGVSRYPNAPAFTSIEDLSVIATPESLRSLADFLRQCADTMEKEGAGLTKEWHMHLRDVAKNWREDMADVIVSAAL